MNGCATRNQPGWEKCAKCNLDGLENCKVANGSVNSIDECRGPYKPRKNPRRKRR